MKNFIVCILSYATLFYGCNAKKDTLAPKVVDVGGHPVLTTQESVLLRGRDISDLNALLLLPNLKSLTLQASKVGDYGALSELNNLKELNLNQVSTINNIKGFENLENLEFLDLSYTNVANIEPLANLERLKVLDLSYTNIKDLSALKNLKLDLLVIENIDPGDGKNLPKVLKMMRLSAKYKYRLKALREKYPETEFLISE